MARQETWPTRHRFVVAAVSLAFGLSIGSLALAEIEGYVVRPIWTRHPSANDLERLYPKDVHGVTADVRADCTIDEEGRFTTCDIVSENPAGMGFGESTIKLAKLFQMKSIDGEGRPVAGRKLHLPVRWRAQ
jgi:hypothetical protein